jgi:hypothetical protein
LASASLAGFPFPCLAFVDASIAVTGAAAYFSEIAARAAAGTATGRAFLAVIARAMGDGAAAGAVGPFTSGALHVPAVPEPSLLVSNISHTTGYRQRLKPMHSAMVVNTPSVAPTRGITRFPVPTPRDWPDRPSVSHQRLRAVRAPGNHTPRPGKSKAARGNSLPRAARWQRADSVG